MISRLDSFTIFTTTLLYQIGNSISGAKNIYIRNSIAKAQTLVKSIELIAGLMLVSGKFVKLGTVLLMPISVNIFLIHLIVSKSDVPMSAAILFANVFLIYAYWNDFKAIVKP